MLWRARSRRSDSNWYVINFPQPFSLCKIRCRHICQLHTSSPKYNLTRTLKQERLRLTQKLTQKDAEAEKMKSKNIKREHEQNLRLAKYREEKKEWSTETEQVKEELGGAKVGLSLGRNQTPRHCNCPCQ